MAASEKDLRVGVVGLGRMGSALLARMAAQGIEVSGWNRTARQDLAATVHSDLADLVAASDIIILSLFDDVAVSSMVGRLCEFDLAGKLLVDTSTTRPETLRDLQAAIGAAGAAALDAPIAGGPEMALGGKIGFYIGGATDDVARFSPVAEAIAGRVLHVGDLGAGATAKVFNNMMLCGYWQILKEAMLTGRAGGLPYAQMLDILSGSPAASGAFKGRIAVLQGEDDTVGFSLDGLVKDAEMFSDVAQSMGIDISAGRAGLESFKQASAQGFGDADLAMMVRVALGEVT
jgi:3-hydroxyisobutyrate dehydrogenase